MRHFLTPLDLSLQELDSLLALADEIARDPAAYHGVCAGKKLATLFYEPSTRTRLSFESAMLNLGGAVLGFSSASSSSVSKGETVADTIRILSCYADICAMRHPVEGAPFRAALYSRIPVINAGDGGHQHPTQTLTDLVTIRRRLGRLDHLTVGFCGDLKYGRTVHSLIAALSRYEGNRFVCISPEELRLPPFVKEEIAGAPSSALTETRALEEALPELNVLYMTRIQQERFTDRTVYERLKGCYVLTADKLAAARADMPVLHPLPRVDEIALEVDSDPRAAYFEQAQNGVYARMALMMTLLGLAPVQLGEGAPLLPEGTERNILRCGDKRCITGAEAGVDHLFVPTRDGSHRCFYCGRRGK